MKIISSIGVAGAMAIVMTSTAVAAQEAADALPNAKPGECYAKVLLPEQYRVEKQEVVQQEAAEKIEVAAAKYETVKEKVLVKEASKKLVAVPAVYETVQEKVETRPAASTWTLGKGSKAPVADPTAIAGAISNGLPAARAKIGGCYAEHYQPAEFKTETVKVVKREASHKFEVVPAQYEWVTENVTIREPSKKLIEVPAVYETVTEKVLETPAYTTWKAGRGPVEKIDHGTGEIMCLVEVPAKYKTITKKVLKTPAKTNEVEIPARTQAIKKRKLVSAASTKRIEIPAEYKTVTKQVKVSDAKTSWIEAGSAVPTTAGKATGRRLCLTEIPAKHEVVTKQVLKTAPTTKEIEIPAEYTTVDVRKLVTPAQEKRIKIPAKTATLEKRIKVSDAKLAWRPVLCETNMSEALVTQIQQALANAGFNPGPVDGRIGQQTMVAVGQYQQQKNLARGGLTMQTLETLGIDITKF